MATTPRLSLRPGPVLVALVVLAGVIAASEPAHAALPRNGTYVFSGDPVEEEHRLDAIDEAASELFFAWRGVARKRLRKSTAIVPTLTVLRSGDRLRMGYEDRFYTVELGAAPVELRVEDSRLIASAREEPGALVVELRTGQGKRVETLTRDGAGNLIVDVYVTGKKLPKPLRYQLTYHPRLQSPSR